MACILDQVSQAVEAGNIGAAERHLRLGLQEYPDDPKLLSYLSVCAASAGREPEAAEELARRIIRDFPREPAGHFALGNAKLIANKRRFAFQSFARARDLAGRDPQLMQELDRREPRRKTVFHWLPRNHFLNVYGGKLRAWFGRARGGD